MILQRNMHPIREMKQANFARLPIFLPLALIKYYTHTNVVFEYFAISCKYMVSILILNNFVVLFSINLHNLPFFRPVVVALNHSL